MSNAKAIFKIVTGKRDSGEHIFSVIVKRTYRIKHGSVAERSANDHELKMIDEYYDNGDPDWSTVQYESELAAFKPLVDVVVIGKAYAPKGEPTQQMMISVRIADKEKTITVFGDRTCHYRENKTPVFSDPLPFTDMEIRYDRAYGGLDDKSDPTIPFYYPRNYMGTGFALRNIKEVIEGLALPNLEDPNDLLTSERIVLEEPQRWHMQPLPQGLGWCQRNWFPRCAFAGSYPAFVEVGTAITEERMGLLPKNYIALAKQFKLPSFHPRFNNGASLGLMFRDMRGDESISLKGMTSSGLLEFSLPNDAPRISLDIGLGEQQLVARLHTVSIRPDDLEVDLIWRGALDYEGYSWLPKMKRLHAEVQ
ncbi:MAG: DUF2169 domain-containing protein [Nitrosomonas sp.]|nr:DUF2169 domain-containing protein [Nitrosomonas sp.]